MFLRFRNGTGRTPLGAKPRSACLSGRIAWSLPQLSEKDSLVTDLTCVLLEGGCGTPLIGVKNARKNKELT